MLFEKRLTHSLSVSQFRKQQFGHLQLAPLSFRVAGTPPADLRIERHIANSCGLAYLVTEVSTQIKT